MTDNDVCPVCGKKTINGVCLDCGVTINLPDAAEAEARHNDRFGSDSGSLEDIVPPTLLSMTGEEILTPDEALEAAKKAEEPADLKREPSNPYSDVIPYERPDFGDNYIEPQKIIKSSRGIPHAAANDHDDPNELISRKVKLKHDKSWHSYWWLILIIFILPINYRFFLLFSLCIGLGLLKFDEQGGRQAGGIILGLTVAKLVLVLLFST